MYRKATIFLFGGISPVRSHTSHPKARAQVGAIYGKNKVEYKDF